MNRNRIEDSQIYKSAMEMYALDQALTVEDRRVLRDFYGAVVDRSRVTNAVAFTSSCVGALVLKKYTEQTVKPNMYKLRYEALMAGGVTRRLQWAQFLVRNFATGNVYKFGLKVAFFSTLATGIVSPMAMGLTARRMVSRFAFELDARDNVNRDNVMRFLDHSGWRRAFLLQNYFAITAEDPSKRAPNPKSFLDGTATSTESPDPGVTAGVSNESRIRFGGGGGGHVGGSIGPINGEFGGGFGGDGEIGDDKV